MNKKQKKSTITGSIHLKSNDNNDNANDKNCESDNANTSFTSDENEGVTIEKKETEKDKKSINAPAPAHGTLKRKTFDNIANNDDDADNHITKERKIHIDTAHKSHLFEQFKFDNGSNNVNKYYIGNNNDDNDNNNKNNNNITNNNPNPIQLITKFIMNTNTTLWWWWVSIFMSYYNFNKRNNIINEYLKMKMLTLWKNISLQRSNVDEINNNNKLKNKIILLDFIKENELMSFKFYKELQRSFHLAKDLVNYIQMQFPEQSTYIFEMETNFLNVFTKRAKEFSNLEFLLLFQIYIQNDNHKKSYQSILEDISEKIHEGQISGKDFCFSEIEQLVMDFGYYSYNDNCIFREEQLVLYEAWDFINMY